MANTTAACFAVTRVSCVGVVRRQQRARGRGRQGGSAGGAGPDSPGHHFGDYTLKREAEGEG